MKTFIQLYGALSLVLFLFTACNYTDNSSEQNLTLLPSPFDRNYQTDIIQKEIQQSPIYIKFTNDPQNYYIDQNIEDIDIRSSISLYYADKIKPEALSASSFLLIDNENNHVNIEFEPIRDTQNNIIGVRIKPRDQLPFAYSANYRLIIESSISQDGAFISGGEFTFITKSQSQTSLLSNVFQVSNTIRPENSTNDFINDIAVDSYSKLYLASTITDKYNQLNMKLIKLNKEGNLDTQFTPFQNISSQSQAKSIAIDAYAGSVYLTGYIRNTQGDKDVAVWKISSDGTLQKKHIYTDISGTSSDELANDIVLSKIDNTLYITGFSTTDTSEKHMFLAKISQDTLNLDTSFGSQGFVQQMSTAGMDIDDRGNAIVLDAMDNIYVAGKSINSNGKSDMVVWKYNSTGQLDSTFNGTGFLIDENTEGGYGAYQGTCIILDNNDNLYIAGQSSFDNNLDMLIWKYHLDGTLNTNFGQNGRLRIANLAKGEGDDEILDMAYAQENIYAVGYSTAPNNIKKAVVLKIPAQVATNTYTEAVIMPNLGQTVANSIALHLSDNIQYLYLGGATGVQNNSAAVLWGYKKPY